MQRERTRMFCLTFPFAWNRIVWGALHTRWQLEPLEIDESMWGKHIVYRVLKKGKNLYMYHSIALSPYVTPESPIPPTGRQAAGWNLILAPSRSGSSTGPGTSVLPSHILPSHWLRQAA